MKCPNCGIIVYRDDARCPHCGNNLSIEPGRPAGDDSLDRLVRGLAEKLERRISFLKTGGWSTNLAMAGELEWVLKELRADAGKSPNEKALRPTPGGK